MREIVTEIAIDAPAGRVWQILTDLAAYPSWNSFILEASGALEPGATLRVRIHPPGERARTFQPVVQVVEPERELAWLGRVALPGLFDGEHRFSIAPAGTGRVRFVQRESFRGVLVPLLWGRMEGPVRRGFVAMNRALKDRAEHGF